MAQGRVYQQRARANSVEQTRRRILDAVHDRLRSGSADAVSVDAVATAAGVTRPTIYSAFGSRDGLFAAAGADVLDRAGFAAVLDSAAHPDALRGMWDGFKAIVDVYANERDIFRSLYTAAQADASSFGGAITHQERGREAGMRNLAGRLHTQGYLGDGLTIEGATNVLWLLTSFESFDLLYTGRGLNSEIVAATLSSTAQLALTVGSNGA